MIGLPIPIWAIAALSAAVIAAAGMWRVMDWRCDAARTEAVARALRQADETARQDAEIAAGYEHERERIRYIYKERQRELPDHVPDSGLCRLDPIGLRLVNAAIRNEPSPSTVKPDYTLPTPDAALQR